MPTAGPDGPGDHARASGSFLTGVRVKKTAGADIHAGISVDQVAAQRIGHLTRFPSLELTCDARAQVGLLRFGLLVRLSIQPVVERADPAGRPRAEPAARLRAALRRRLAGRAPQEPGATARAAAVDPGFRARRHPQPGAGARRKRDQQKLDEYLAGIREVERRIQQAERFKDIPNPAVETPSGIPGSFPDHIQLMFDMMVLAFQTDSTRIATFLLANEGSNRTFPEIGISEGHHNLSHHFGKKDMMEKIGSIDRWYIAAIRQVPREARVDQRRRRAFAPAQFDDRLWQRKLRRQPAHAFEPADHPRRQRRRKPDDRALCEVQGQAAQQPLPEHAGSLRRRRRRPPRRFHRAHRGGLIMPSRRASSSVHCSPVDVQWPSRCAIGALRATASSEIQHASRSARNRAEARSAFLAPKTIPRIPDRVLKAA